MTARVLFAPLAAAIAALALFAAIAGIGGAADEPAPTVSDPETRTVTIDRLHAGKTARQWHAIAARYRAQARARWQPTAKYALELASRVFGVSRWEMQAVAYCESRLYAFATNGRYKGMFQLGWSPFGFSPYDPVANALSAAQTVVRDGGWRQWECKP